MPEGPEIWALAEAASLTGISVIAYGKHLLHEKQDIHFGLNGRVTLKDDGLLELVRKDGISGRSVSCADLAELVTSNDLGIDWMTATPAAIRRAISQAYLSRKQLGPWMLQQKVIAGVGVAWASEIMHRVGLIPTKPCNEQNLLRLAESYISIRDEVKSQYADLVSSASSPREFVYGWCDNLYRHRVMKVYRKGTEVLASGRTYWI
jgi:formamidopyrimidine-DNA glycosylase